MGSPWRLPRASVHSAPQRSSRRSSGCGVASLPSASTAESRRTARSTLSWGSSRFERHWRPSSSSSRRFRWLWWLQRR